MGRKSRDELADILLALIPADGAAIGNIRLRTEFVEHLGRDVEKAEYEAVKSILLERGDTLRGTAAACPRQAAPRRAS